MLTLATYVRALKKYANNISVSEDEFFRALFGYVIETLDIRSKKDKDELYDFTKSRISGILTQKEDVPSAIRKAVSHYSAKKKVMDVFPDFLDDHMNPSKLDVVVDDIKDLLKSDISFSKKSVQDFCALDNNEFLSIMFIEAIKSNNLTEWREKELWHRGNDSIKLVCNDLIKVAFETNLSERRIVVIPVNSAFDTQLSTNAEVDLFPLISEKTIHGQWLTRILPIIGKEELDQRIQSHLHNAGAISTGKSQGLGGKTEKYPIGTTVIIQHENTIYYLLAISDFDNKNVARSSKQFIKSAVESLLDYYDRLGLGYEIYLPLLGTGKSRAYLSPKESLDLIRDTLLAHKEKINGHINIVVLETMIAELS